MEKFLSIFVVCLLAGSLLVCLFFYCKNCRAKNEAEHQKEVERWKKEADKRELKEACKKGDIDKMMELLEKGVDPNTRVQLWEFEHDEFREISYQVTKTLLDISYNPAAKKLLRAYGAKTIREICAEKAVIEKADNDAKKAEMRRQEAIRQAEKKAKEEADMRKVEAFLLKKK